MIRIVRWIVAIVHVAVLLAATSAMGQYPYSSVCELRVPTHTGSGALIGFNGDTALVLSCRHVCEQVGRPIECNFLWAGNQRMQGKVIAILPGGGFDTDLALVQCKRPKNVRAIPLAAYNEANGPWVGVGFRQRQLRFSVAKTATYNMGLIALDSIYVGGQSGGPCLDRNGRIVAVVVASDGRTVGVATDGPNLHALIARHTR